MNNLKPITRTEHFMGRAAGNPGAEKLTPITREERFLKDIAEAVEGGSEVTPDSVVSATAAMTPEQAAQTRQNIGADTPETVAEWLNEHVNPETGYVIDDSLTVEGAAADAKATGEAVGELKSAINNESNICNTELFSFAQKTVDSNASKRKLNVDTGLYSADNSYKVQKFAVTAGNLYKVVSDYAFQFQTDSTVATSGEATRVGSSYGAGTFIVAAPLTATYLMVCTFADGSTSAVYTATSNISNINSELSGINDGIAIAHADATRIMSKSVNKFDKTDVTSGQFWRSTGTLSTGENEKYKTTGYIYVEPGTYKFSIDSDNFGANNAQAVAIFGKDKTLQRVIQGTVSSDTATFTMTDFGYVQFNVSSGDSGNIDTAMFTVQTEWPMQYAAFSEKIQSKYIDFPPISTAVPNTLYQKTAIFDGDSICASATDLSEAGAYAGRIAENNNMTIHNYAVQGGTLATGTYSPGGQAKHWISDNVDTMFSDYPNADFIIFEGGTNDADKFGPVEDPENPPTGFGSWSEDDFSGEYDDETFCGAVETVFYKAITNWPSKKIGFVIAMRMGRNVAGEGEDVSSYERRYYYFQTIMKICKKWGIPYINLWDDCPMNPNIASCWKRGENQQWQIDNGRLYLDGQHPTPLGYDVIAPKIEAWMRTL